MSPTIAVMDQCTLESASDRAGRGGAAEPPRGSDLVLLRLLFGGRRPLRLRALLVLRCGSLRVGLPLLVHAFLTRRLAAGDVARRLLSTAEQLVEESHVVPPFDGEARAYSARRRASRAQADAPAREVVGEAAGIRLEVLLGDPAVVLELVDQDG